jgi:polysaccharide export outer membrane protein
MRRFCLFFALFSASFLAGCGVLAPQPEPLSPAVLPAAAALKAGDRLDVKVADEEAFSGVFTIAADGTVRVEPLGDIAAAGLPMAEFQETLRQRLLAGYLKNPQVTVALAASEPPRIADGAPGLRPSQAEGH